MRIHILGIAGTFMAGLARLAVQAGHQVSGSDNNIYPPMSTQLEDLGVRLYPTDSTEDIFDQADHFIVGNVMSRSMPIVEQLLNRGVAYSSGPHWLYQNILSQRTVLAVAGTHGKTTTSSMLAWMLRSNGIDAGFLIGGVADNFGVSAELGSANHFVIEADEYDTAFFDKRPKFLHYHPSVLIINNIEHDHVDIYPCLSDVLRAFHELIRQLPGNTHIVARADDKNIKRLFEQGLWSELIHFNDPKSWTISLDDGRAEIFEHGQFRGEFRLQADTRFNRLNALSAALAAQEAGVELAAGCQSMDSFRGVRRRFRILHESGQTRLFEDFAHHPTAIAGMIEELSRRIKRAGCGRLLLLLELGSHSMRSGHQLEELIKALSKTARAWIYCDKKTLYNGLGKWRTRLESEPSISIGHNTSELLDSICSFLRRDDQFIIMSNRHFDGSMSTISQGLIEKIDQLETKASNT